MSTTAGNTVLVASNVSKTFGATKALDSLDLKIKAGEIKALLGENGSGKSTLIKILSGFHTPDTNSSIEIDGIALAFGDHEASWKAGLRFVHQNLGLIESMSVADNLFLENGYPRSLGTINSRRMRREAIEMLSKVSLDINIDSLIADVSPAIRTGVALAKALRDDQRSRTSYLILDEPTATMPEREVSFLLNMIKNIANAGVGVLYVTHRLQEVFEIASSVTVIRDGKVIKSSEVSNITHEELVRHLLGAELEPLTQSNRGCLVPNGQKPLLTVRSLEAPRLHGISLSVAAGEIVGIAGLTGSGREELCGAIFGANTRQHGNVSIDGSVVPVDRPDLSIKCGACFVSADRSRDGGFMAMSAKENISITKVQSYWRWPLIRNKQENLASNEWYIRMQVRPSGALEQPLSSFSGGNQQKIILARWLQLQPKLLLLDEPTQGVDVGTKTFIHQQLTNIAFGGAAVVISSSDNEELAEICDRVLVMYNGQVIESLHESAIEQNQINAACVRGRQV